MNNKGFTLIELIASIVILALIMVIAVPSYYKINDTIRNSQRKNLIGEIEIAASKYAFDTNETLIFVDKLVTLGYLESDEEGNVIDPVSNQKLNCYLVEMEKDGNNYKAKLKDDQDYSNNGVCDTNKLNDLNNQVTITATSDGVAVTDFNKWIRGNAIILRASGRDIDCVKNQCVWTSSSGLYINGPVAKLNDITVINTQYKFQMTKYSDTDNSITRYNATLDLKVDNEAPTIYHDEIETKITNRYIDTKTKKVTLVASDGKGSGIAGYFFGVKRIGFLSCSNLSQNLYLKNNTFDVTRAGEYLICVIDNAGNYSSDTITIDHIVS